MSIEGVPFDLSLLGLSITYQGPFWWRALSTAKVGEGPGGISDHGEFVLLVEYVQQRNQCILAKDDIAAARTVSCNVSKGPNGLCVWGRGGEKGYKFMQYESCLHSCK